MKGWNKNDGKERGVLYWLQLGRLMISVDEDIAHTFLQKKSWSTREKISDGDLRGRGFVEGEETADETNNNKKLRRRKQKDDVREVPDDMTRGWGW